MTMGCVGMGRNGRSRSFDSLRSLRMTGVSFVRVSGTGDVLFWRDDIDFGSSDASPAYLAHFKARADVERGGGFCKEVEGDAGIDERAEHHVAAYTGKTF